MPQTTETAAAEARPDPLWEATQLDGQSVEDKARVAISHALRQIRDNRIVGYQMGVGGQAFALLTEALAALMNVPVREVRERYVCRNALRVDPDDKPRLDWLQNRFREMPVSYGDLVGLPRGWQAMSLREGIDEARREEGES